MGRRPLPVGVQTATPERLALPPLEDPGVGLRHGDLGPQAVRLVGLDAGSPQSLDQQSRHMQRLIADLLCGQPLPGVSGVQRGIAGADFIRSLPIGAAEHDGPNQFAYVPPAIAKPDCEPVEQFGMTRPASLESEVLDGLGEPLAEEHRPDAIGGHAGGQRILIADQPSSQIDSRGDALDVEAAEDGGNRAGDRAGLVCGVVEPAHHHEGRTDFRPLIHDHGHRKPGSHAFEFGVLRIDRGGQFQPTRRVGRAPRDAGTLVESIRGLGWKQPCKHVRSECIRRRLLPVVHRGGTAGVDDLHHKGAASGRKIDRDRILIGCDPAVDPVLVDEFAVEVDEDAVVAAEREFDGARSRRVELPGHVLGPDSLGESNGLPLQYERSVTPLPALVGGHEIERPRGLGPECRVVARFRRAGSERTRDVPVGPGRRQTRQHVRRNLGELDPDVAETVMGIGGMKPEGDDHDASILEAERRLGQEHRDPIIGRLMSVDGPDPPVVGTQRVDDAEVRILLLHIRPGPGQRNRPPNGGIGAGDHLDGDAAQHAIAVRGAPDAATRQRFVTQHLERDRTQIRPIGLEDDGVVVIDRCRRRREHRTVGLDLESASRTADRGEDGRNRPAPVVAAKSVLEVGDAFVLERIRPITLDLERSQRGRQRIDASLIRTGRDREVRLQCPVWIGRLRIEPRLLVVVEEGEDPVVVLHRQRVVLVVMALGAADRQSEEDVPQGVGPLHRVLESRLLVDRSALVRGHVTPVESACDQLGGRAIRQQIASQLLHHELVERHVGEVGVEHPVPIGPDGAPRIHVDAARIGVSGQIEPWSGQPFGMPARIRLLGHQSLDQLLVRVRIRIRDEPIDLGRSRGEPGQIQIHPSSQGGTIRIGIRPQVPFLQRLEYESIDFVADPRILDAGNLRNRQRNERPVAFVLRPLFDPDPHEPPLFIGQRSLAAVGRRHHLVGVRRGDPLPDQRRGGITGDDRGSIRANGRRCFEAVESQSRLLLGSIRTVTQKASIGKNRSDVTSVPDVVHAGHRCTCTDQQKRSMHAEIHHELTISGSI